MRNHLILFIFYTFLKLLIYLDQHVRFFPELVFFDVGQGDAIFITTPQKKAILIDGGPGYTVSHKLNSYFPLNNCHLEAVFLTHPHADHLEGLNRVLDNCHIKRIFYTPAVYESSLYDDFQETALKKTKNGALVTPFLSGDIYKPEKFGNLVFFGVWPPNHYIGKSLSNINNVSTMLFLDFGKFEALITGDAELEVLREINSSFIKNEFGFLDGSLEVYKLSHHGAKNGFNAEFWNNLNPLLTVISVGAVNKFGHPHPEVLDWLENVNARYLRTDIEGNIKIRYNSF